MSKKIRLVWDDGTDVSIAMVDNPVSDYYFGAVKHLQHIDLEFDARSNPYEFDRLTKDRLVLDMVQLAKQNGLTIEIDRLDQQSYLNQLHDEYFQGISDIEHWNKDWLKFHDTIHMMEQINGTGNKNQAVWFDYNTRAGLLEKKFDRDWLKYAVTEVDPGTCYIGEAELGKSIITYYKDKEPAEINAICRLAKPWIKMRPLMRICTESNRKYQSWLPEKERFERWFAPFQKDWCHHWHINGWEPWEVFAMIPIGQVENFDVLKQKFQKSDYPRRVVPCVQQN